MARLKVKFAQRTGLTVMMVFIFRLAMPTSLGSCSKIMLHQTPMFKYCKLIGAKGIFQLCNHFLSAKLYFLDSVHGAQRLVDDSDYSSAAEAMQQQKEQQLSKRGRKQVPNRKYITEDDHSRAKKKKVSEPRETSDDEEIEPASEDDEPPTDSGDENLGNYLFNFFQFFSTNISFRVTDDQICWRYC
jgi:hypothetical protein